MSTLTLEPFRPIRLPQLAWSIAPLREGLRGLGRKLLLRQVSDRAMSKIECASLSEVWRLRAAEILVVIRTAHPEEENVVELEPNEGGGLALEWVRANRRLSVVLPVEGAHVFYSARDADRERAGFARTGAENELARWLATGTPFPDAINVG